jgi:hypothetical protein
MLMWDRHANWDDNAHVGTAALGCPVKQKLNQFYLAFGWRSAFSAAIRLSFFRL